MGGQVLSPSSSPIRPLSALTGYEWAFLDAEHAPFTPMLLADMIHNISFHSQGKMIPVVRVPSHEPSFIGVALDAGAAGIVLPHSETREQAQYLVNNCKFAPQGKRSYPPWSWIPGINNAVPEGQVSYYYHPSES
jgi:2-keto-3-deoxy-L-rhamnonate aldolase RhmA